MKDNNRWQRTRQMGRRKFVLLYGAFFMGLGATILSYVVRLAIRGQLPTHPGLELAISMIIFPVAGTVWALFMWQHFEKQFSSPKE